MPRDQINLCAMFVVLKVNFGVRWNYNCDPVHLKIRVRGFLKKMKRSAKYSDDDDDLDDFFGDMDFDEDDDEDGGGKDLSIRHSDFAHNLFISEPELKQTMPAPPPQPSKQRQVPFESKNDLSQQRPGYQIVDNVSYYNLGFLVVLLFANASEGVSIPAVFDAEKQSM
jgi:hypothetical protein